jgi:hypothetical protein
MSAPFKDRGFLPGSLVGVVLVWGITGAALVSLGYSWLPFWAYISRYITHTYQATRYPAPQCGPTRSGSTRSITSGLDQRSRGAHGNQGEQRWLAGWRAISNSARAQTTFVASGYSADPSIVQRTDRGSSGSTHSNQYVTV